MRGRLVWAALALCLAVMPCMAISPGGGAAATDSGQQHGAGAPSASTPTISRETAKTVDNGLKYFRFDPEDEGKPAPTGVPAPATTAQLVQPAPEAPAVEIGASIAAFLSRCATGIGAGWQWICFQCGRLSAFGAWCSETGQNIANLYHTVVDSFQRVQEASAKLNNPSAPAQPAPPAASPFRYAWENPSGDRLYSDNPKFDPNSGGMPMWRRVEPAPSG